VSSGLLCVEDMQAGHLRTDVLVLRVIGYTNNRSMGNISHNLITHLGIIITPTIEMCQLCSFVRNLQTEIGHDSLGGLYTPNPKLIAHIGKLFGEYLHLAVLERNLPSPCQIFATGTQFGFVKTRSFPSLFVDPCENLLRQYNAHFILCW
jgi:hypothetical protein